MPLDLSMAGYLTIIPTILIIISQWAKHTLIIKRILRIYFYIIAIFMASAMCLDLALYGYWGFRLDMTPIFYFSTSPSAALASVPLYFFLIGTTASIILAIGMGYILNRAITHYIPSTQQTFHKIRNTIVLTIILISLFIPIRGGFTVSTMNLSAAYFSQKQELNHAAINPLFSFMYSATHQNNFSSQFRYFESAEADNIYSHFSQSDTSDSIISLLNNKRPDIYIIILESFSSHLLNSKCDGQPITPHLDTIASQGILFTNFYASGVRTDRGIPAILSGYPAQPTTSIMKYVEKTDNLPSLPRSLKNAGWETAYYYGGDANFTNMHAYLVSSGFETIISDKDFPISERLSKWGTHDHHVFNRCSDDISKSTSNKPQLRVIQTSSSHEPFEVPYNRLTNNRANAFAYTDSCLGNFISNLKKLDKWNNALIILSPDHYGSYPLDITNYIDRHRIPLILTGGAISDTTQITTVGSQTDIAATLLSQLGIDHSEFIFSKDLFNSKAPHYAFISSPSLFGFIEKDNYVIFNYEANQIVEAQGINNNHTLDKGKAFIQKLYDDLDKR